MGYCLIVEVFPGKIPPPKNNRPMTKSRKTTAILASLGMTVAAHAATIIPLTGDASSSSTPGFGSSIAGTTTDGFAYDPVNPLATNPGLGFSAGSSFHANEPDSGLVTMTYDTAAHTIVLPDEVVVFDIWGRQDGANGNRWQDRDNDFDVELFDSAGGSLGIVTGLAIADGPTSVQVQHARASFGAIPVGTILGQVVVTARDSSNAGAPGDINNFTVQEVRLAAIPEPSSALLALIGLGFGLRRRR